VRDCRNDAIAITTRAIVAHFMTLLADLGEAAGLH